jgi:hypothetical protein
MEVFTHMRFSLVFATLAMSTVVFAQVTASFVGNDGPYQLGFAANLNVGDSVVNVTNSGSYSGFMPNRNGVGNLCVNVYTFDPQEEEIACCSCLVTPNGLNSLSVKNDLISNTLTPAIPNSVVIKLTASRPNIDESRNFTTCNPSTAGTTGNLALIYGMVAWGSTLEPGAGAGNYNAVNVPFVQATLSEGVVCSPVYDACQFVNNVPLHPESELAGLTSVCNFIQANGTGFGICKSCRLGALGGAKQ